MLVLTLSVFVSIPFIAGQWSLRKENFRETAKEVSFQSPSLRGSGRFRPHTQSKPAAHPYRFNPLHCGAVVASEDVLGDPQPTTYGFNPLHCGAVVASDPGTWPDQDDRTGFNPLHCGAVVASLACREPCYVLLEFQSPSLRGSGRFPEIPSFLVPYLVAFQSPSLRGSGRFPLIR